MAREACPDGGGARRRSWTESRECVRAWFYSDATSAAAAWFAIIVACAAALAWFFIVSPYGAPAAPVYAEF